MPRGAKTLDWRVAANQSITGEIRDGNNELGCDYNYVYTRREIYLVGKARAGLKSMTCEGVAILQLFAHAVIRKTATDNGRYSATKSACRRVTQGSFAQ